MPRIRDFDQLEPRCFARTLPVLALGRPVGFGGPLNPEQSRQREERYAQDQRHDRCQILVERSESRVEQA